MPQDTLKRPQITPEAPAETPAKPPAWVLTPLPRVHVELVDAGQAISPPAKEPPDLLVESFCEV